MALIHDKVRETNFYSDDPNIIKMAEKGGDYEIISEKSAADIRRDELNAMNRTDLDKHALTLNLKPVDYKTKPEIVEAVFVTESGGVTNAGNA